MLNHLAQFFQHRIVDMHDYEQIEWFESDYINQYMCSISQVRVEKRSLVPAITHIDGSARLQTVDEFSNYKLSSLILGKSKYGKIFK